MVVECNAHLVTQQALLQHRGALLGGIRFNTLVIDYLWYYVWNSKSMAEWDMYEVLGECLDRNSVFKSYIRANWNKYVSCETELYYNMGWSLIGG